MANAVFWASDLNGSNGFLIMDYNAVVSAGSSVAGGGDFNGDGIDDVIIGAQQDHQGYLVFGSTTPFTPTLDFSDLNGANGARIFHTGFSEMGSAVAFADINGDGFDDALLGATVGDMSYNGLTFVVFGASGGVGPAFDVSALDGSSGFVVQGFADYAFAGRALGSGDFNGDGLDDMIVGAPGSGQYAPYSAGAAYVIFGATSGFGAAFEISALNGSNGLAINGIAERDAAGSAVSGAGDVNGDGIEDILIGAPQADPNGVIEAGSSYVVFGSSTGFAASLDLSALDGSNGFALNGIATLDRSGNGVSGAGDINGDGIDDLIVGAAVADPNAVDRAGSSYVVFGSTAGFASSIELSLLNGMNGFAINGANAGDLSGASVSAAGDINGDGWDDLLIGARGFNSAPFSDDSGAAYVVFGSSAGFAASIDLSAIDGTNGFVIRGLPYSETGNAVSAAGDVNGDGLDDIIVAASGRSFTYIIFGSTSFGAPDGPTNGDDNLVGGAGADAIDALDGDDTVDGLGSGDTLTGGAGDDSLLGNDGNDRLFGNDGLDTLVGGAGADTAIGGLGADTLLGLGGRDVLNGNAGRDSLHGGGANDRLFGESGNDILDGGGGHDRLDGGAGHDSAQGGGGRDVIAGGAGDDTLKGGTDNDTLIGGGGDDLLIGNTGNDRLDFIGTGFGADRILGFSAGAGPGDVIRLAGLGSAFDSFAEVIAAATQAGADTVIDFGGGDTITLAGVSLINLNSDDFTFT